MKDIRDIITFIEKNLSEELIEINSSLELLQEVLNNTNNKISYIMSEFAKNNRHEEAREFLDNSEKIYNYINILDNILNEIATISKKKREKREIPDYEKHIVDNTKVHYLNENFTYKRPYAFVIEGNMIKVNTWVQMLLETCRILIKKDENLFMTFINSSDFKGKKRAYFSDSKQNIRKPERLKYLGIELYVETNLSANFIVKIIAKMINIYKINVEEYKIYLKADYTELHN